MVVPRYRRILLRRTRIAGRVMMLATVFNLVAGPIPLLLLLGTVFMFGGKKIPALARSLRSSLGEFRRGKEEGLAPQDTPPKAVSRAEKKP